MKEAQYFIILHTFFHQEHQSKCLQYTKKWLIKNSGSISGHDLPHYLLDRASNESSIDNDGASRIFSTTDSSETTAKDTDVSITSRSFDTSSLNVSSIYNTSDRFSRVERYSFQYESRSNLSFLHDEYSDSRTIRNDNPTSSASTYITNSIHENAPEASMLSNMSSIDISCSIPVCLTKDGDYETSALLSDPFYSNDYTEPKNMFPP
ncbi:unnamed protein product [Rotaria magnacalcarata]|nr:unnamed protein product [Rotaria magnacalcarata]